MKTWVFVALTVPVSLVGCGGGNVGSKVQSSSAVPVTAPSGGSAPSGTGGAVISGIQTSSGNWRTWGQLPPQYVNCPTASPCGGITWSMDYGITSPSLSGKATKFSLGGTASYADALFSAQIIGQNSPEIPDASHTLLPGLHNFTYDSYVYVTNASITQALEFDISMYMNGVGMIWGHQCNHLGDGDWDIWDNLNNTWVSAGVPCQLVNGWNHVTIHTQRQSDNALLYESVELNGTSYLLNMTYPAGTANSNWWGVTGNYQMDGNSAQSANTTYLDNFTITYW